MKTKITDSIFADAVKDMFSNESISKTAFDINMAASTLLGYSAGNIAGKAIGQGMASDKILRENLAKSDIPSLDGDYYSQVDNISKKLKVIFTPISVVYTVEDKGRNVTLDVIEKSEMNERMKEAYTQKDADFFKNLIINKIKLDIQDVEQLFSKKLLEANNKLSSKINKKASDEADCEGDIFTDIKSFHTIQRVVDKYPERGISNFIKEAAENIEAMKVRFELERPIKNYSELGECEINIFKIAKSLDDDKQKKLLNPKYIKNKVKIGFVADRVTFTVDDMIIAQLHIMAMNEEGYEKFRKKDREYFKNLFLKEANNSELVKVAKEVLEIRDIFYNSTTHPKVYYLVLNGKFGKEWLEYDPEALIKVIETEFGLTEAIYDRALDKILCIHNLCNSTDCLTNAFIFEKAARALNNKPISFTEWEYNLTPGELINALQIMDELTPTNDIFDDLSEKVVAYISKAFVVGDCRAILPNKKIISSELEQRFFEILNSDINQRWSSLNSEEMVYQRYIQPLSSAIVKGVRKIKKYNSEVIESILQSLVQKSNITDQRVINLSRQTAIANLSIDIMLDEVEKELNDMRKLLNI